MDNPLLEFSPVRLVPGWDFACNYTFPPLLPFIHSTSPNPFAVLPKGTFYNFFFLTIFKGYFPFQFSSVTQSCLTLSNPMNRSMPGLPVHHPNSWNPHKPMPIELVMPSSHLILCRPLLLLPPVPPIIRVFSNESALCTRWPKYWSFSFSISPSNEHPGLISFRMDWLDLLAVQGTLKSLLQHHKMWDVK